MSEAPCYPSTPLWVVKSFRYNSRVAFHDMKKNVLVYYDTNVHRRILDAERYHIEWLRVLQGNFNSNIRQ